MPIYTFECEGCGAFDEILHMDTPHFEHECPSCGKPAPRAWRPAQVIQDNFDEPLRVTTLRPVYNPDPHGCDVVHSRSELRKLEKAHDRKYGTKLEHAR